MKLKTFQRKTARASVEGEHRPALNQPRPFAQPAAPEQHTPSASLRARDGQAEAEGHNFGRVAVSGRDDARAGLAGGGLPDELRAGVEKLSGVSLADVRVHYDSPRPSRMGARAYTQGREIHVARGEERHLAHEAWHVVQQKRGRVRADARLGSSGVNTSAALEREADLMGARAERGGMGSAPSCPKVSPVAARAPSAAPIQGKWIWRDGKQVQVPDNYVLQPGERVRSSSFSSGSGSVAPLRTRSSSTSGTLLPPNLAPQNVVPQNVVPQNIVPQNDVPQNIVPQNIVPQNIDQQHDLPQVNPLLPPLQQDDVPKLNAPQNDAPQNDLPVSNVQPNDVALNDVRPSDAPQNVISQNVISQNVISQNVTSQNVVSRDDSPQRVVRRDDSLVAHDSDSESEIEPVDQSSRRREMRREIRRGKRPLRLDSNSSSSSSSSSSDSESEEPLILNRASSNRNRRPSPPTRRPVLPPNQGIDLLDEGSSLLRGNRGGRYDAINNNDQQQGNLQPQQPGLWQRIKNWFSTPSMGEQIITASSPGIYTGPGGGVGAAASNALALSNSAQQGFSLDSINNPSSTVNTLGQIGSFASGTGDLLAIGRSSQTIHNARQVLNKPKNQTTKPQRALARRQRRGAAVDLTTQLTDTGAQTSSLVSSFAQHGSAVATHAGQVAPFLSVPVSGIVGARAAWRGGRAAMHEHELGKLDTGGMSQGMREATEFSRHQMKKRKWRNAIGGFGAALGVGGGLALGLGALGVGAAMATPIGWGLAAGAGAIALGVGAHKLYRWWKKRKGQGDEKLGAARERHAAALHSAITNRDPNDQQSEADYQSATQILKARGIKEKHVSGEGGKDFLKRKLEGW